MWVNLAHMYSIQGWSKISHVCNGSQKGRYFICDEYGEPIHVEGRSTTLDGHEMHHEVFDKQRLILRGFCNAC